MRFRIIHCFAAWLAVVFAHTAASKSHAAGLSGFEELWKSKGPHTVLAPSQEKLGMNDLEMSAFVYSNYQWLSLNKSRFWIMASSNVGITGYQSLSRLLDSQNMVLGDLIRRFDAEKKKNSTAYNQVINAWNAATAAAATPPPSFPPCHNPGFENPANGHFDGWAGWKGIACFYKPDLACNSFVTPLLPGGFTSNLTMVTGGFDPLVGGNILPMVAPGGSHSVRLENTVNGGDAAMLRYSFTPDPGNPIYELKYALVLEEPDGGHAPEERPYFMISAFDKTANCKVRCSEYRVVAFAQDPEFGDKYFTRINPGSQTRFKPWSSRMIDLSSRIGHEIEVTIVVSDCALGGHLGYAYVDGNCVSDNLTIGPCQSDGTRQLSMDGKFSNYNWISPNNAIIGTNKGKVVQLNKPGLIKLDYFNNGSSCRLQKSFIIDSCLQPSVAPCLITINQIMAGPCQGADGTYTLDINVSISQFSGPGYLKLQYGAIEKFLTLPQATPINMSLPALRADGGKHAIKIFLFADRYVSEAKALCSVVDTVQAPAPCAAVDTQQCEYCIGSFRPEPGATYAFSAWVKESGAAPDATSYLQAQVQLQYTGAAAPQAFFGSGRIIEGWQRIYQEFTIPMSAIELFVQLKTSGGTAYFDDIRIYPVRGSMKSYVYDPVSLKLVAVLDENNYATYYEYDQEGSLVRTKKETERGVVTISENRQSNPKKP